MNQEFLIERARVRALPDERIVNTLGGTGRRGLYLTNFRLVYTGWNPLFKVLPIPGEEIRQIAMLQDVDYVGTVVRKLPFPVLLVGLWAAPAGVAIAVTVGIWGIAIALAGLALIASWIFFKWRFLRFTVSGARHFEYDLVYAITEARYIDDFLNDLFEQKFALSRRPQDAASQAVEAEPQPAPVPGSTL